MKLTDKADYSFRVILYLLEKSEQVKIQEIADYFGISKNHLKVIVSQLVALNVLDTHTGPNGGITLRLDVLEMGVGDLMQKLENMNIVECFNPETNTCVINANCRLKKILRKANRAFIDSLNQTKVKNLI
ncbi:MAG: RrF2 family transcriptional regulator [Bacteriovorax sp.]